MTIAEEIAKRLSGVERIENTARDRAIDAVFDLTIAAIAGFESLGGRAARRAAPAIWGDGPASCWFTAGKLTVPGAAFMNSAIASMLDLDDGHRAASGHPGASIIPAVLAAAESRTESADRSLTAIVLGYEIAIRIAAARDFSKLDTLVSGPWCGQGAAAAVAWLQQLSPTQTAQAIAIAGSSAPNLGAIACSRIMGNHVKEGIPWATVTGLAAVELAASGFTGPTDLLDNVAIYDSDKLLQGFGANWLIESIYFKPYSCCRWAHAAIEALLQIMAAESISPDMIMSIQVYTFSWALRLNNETKPKTLESAQYSVPYCLALAAVRGSDALLPMRESALGDPAVEDLAARVGLKVDPQFEVQFPESVPARIEIRTRTGHHSHTVLAPKGEPTNAMSRGDLEDKFSIAVGDLVTPRFAETLFQAFGALDGGDLKPLVRTLGQPYGPEGEPDGTPAGYGRDLMGLSSMSGRREWSASYSSDR